MVSVGPLGGVWTLNLLQEKSQRALPLGIPTYTLAIFSPRVASFHLDICFLPPTPDTMLLSLTCGFPHALDYAPHCLARCSVGMRRHEPAMPWYENQSSGVGLNPTTCRAVTTPRLTASFRSGATSSFRSRSTHAIR